MAGRYRRRRSDPGSPLVDLDVVFADDALVDSIASSRWGAPAPQNGLTTGFRGGGSTPAGGGLLTADPLTELFQTWRQELAAVPMPLPPPVHRVEATKSETGPRRPAARRSLRAALMIGAAIVALLAGSATVGARGASPGDDLWPLTEMLWPERAQSVESGRQVYIALGEARSALRAGRSQDAQLALLRAAVQLGNVDAVDGRVVLEQAVTELWVVAVPGDIGADPRLSRTGAASTSSSPWSAEKAVSPTVVGTASEVQVAVGAEVPAAVPQLTLPVAAGAGGAAGSLAGTGGNGSALPPLGAAAVDGSNSGASSTSTAPSPEVEQSAPDTVASTQPAQSAPSTPPPPTVAADPDPTAVSTGPSTVSATEQSAPAPTPSAPTTPATPPGNDTDNTAANPVGPVAATAVAAGSSTVAGSAIGQSPVGGTDEFS